MYFLFIWGGGLSLGGGREEGEAVIFYLFLYIWGFQGKDGEFLRQLNFLSFHFSRELGAFLAIGGRSPIFCFGGGLFLGELWF